MHESLSSFPVEDIKRTLDAMSWVKVRPIPEVGTKDDICPKLNMFHWHIVDSQSFPLEVAGFEELSQNGAYSAEEVYKKSDVEDVIMYAGSVGQPSIRKQFTCFIFRLREA